MTDAARVDAPGMDAGGLHARVRYTEPMVRRAVRVYVWRTVLRRGWLWLLLGALLGAGTALALEAGHPLGTGAGAALLVAGFFVVALWRAHLRNTLDRFRALDPPEADVTAGAEGLSVRSSEGAATLPWHRFQAVWTLPDCWMLFLAPNQFMTLPTADLPPAMLAMLRERLPKPR